MSHIIKVSNLTKMYKVKHLQNKPQLSSHLSLDKLHNLIFKNPAEKLENFYAINDISFEIAQGDRLAIVGSNGSGKSTLLKILSRIILPTSGEAVINGKLTSLLEVGTGFHPDLSGRENIFLNGSILGVSIANIKKNFDEIVSFSGIERFIDVPVKNYSSGMYVRLAFSAAIHLAPEILIVDEVLAVGDISFQKKCIDKIQALVKNGVTLIFVSHNTDLIDPICNKALFLESGRLRAFGTFREVVRQYENVTQSHAGA